MVLGAGNGEKKSVEGTRNENEKRLVMRRGWCDIVRNRENFEGQKPFFILFLTYIKIYK